MKPEDTKGVQTRVKKGTLLHPYRGLCVCVYPEDKTQ
jgi:hypothetical protein